MSFKIFYGSVGTLLFVFLSRVIQNVHPLSSYSKQSVSFAVFYIQFLKVKQTIYIVLISELKRCWLLEFGNIWTELGQLPPSGLYATLS